MGEQAAASVAAARSTVAAATAALDDTPLGMPLPGVSAALAAGAAVTAAHQTLALEALAAVTLLRQQEVTALDWGMKLGSVFCRVIYRPGTLKAVTLSPLSY